MTEQELNDQNPSQVLAYMKLYPRAGCNREGAALIEDLQKQVAELTNQLQQCRGQQ